MEEEFFICPECKLPCTALIDNVCVHCYSIAHPTSMAPANAYKVLARTEPYLQEKGLSLFASDTPSQAYLDMLRHEERIDNILTFVIGCVIVILLVATVGFYVWLVKRFVPSNLEWIGPTALFLLGAWIGWRRS